MKNQKINLLLLFSIILFSFELKSSLAQSEINWANFTPSPCYEGVQTENQRGKWKGPFSFRVCPDGPNGCCFTVIYYDRMFKENSTDCVLGRWQYDVSVTGIFYENENCKNYIKDDIISDFHEKLFILKNQSQSFKDSVTGCCSVNGTNNSEHHIWLSSNCYNQNVLCSDNQIRCCRMLRKANYNRTEINGVIHCDFIGLSTYTTPDPVTPACPSGCTPKCNDVLMEHISVTACDMPFNWGEWSQNKTVSYVPDPSCPACVVTITYKDRTTTGCNPNYKDYKIENISFPMFGCSAPLCHSLVTVNNALMAYSMNFLLNHLVEDMNMQIEDCVDNIRIMKSTCFDYYVDNGGNHWLKPCQDKYYCCWVNLRICKTGENTFTKTILQSSGVNEFFDCESPQSSSCTSYCFNDWFQPQTFNTNVDFINYLLNNYKETK